MSLAAKYRRQAADHEQRRQYELALAAYEAAIREDDVARAEVDVALLNKVGDLAMRLGRVPESVAYYERAIDSYVAAERYNNAIALCNKVLRAAPGRAATYLTLGRICAGKGLRNDAARNFLEYATRMQKDGGVEEAGHALREAAELFPDLPELRRLVVELGGALPDMGAAPASRSATPPSPPLSLRGPSLPGAAPAAARPDGLVFLEVGYLGPSASPEAPSGDEVAVPPDAPADGSAMAWGEIGGSRPLDVEPPGTAPTSGAVPASPDRRPQVPPDVGWELDFVATALEGVEAAPARADATPPTLKGVLVQDARDDARMAPQRDAGDHSMASSQSAMPDGAVAPPFRLNPHDFILPGELPPLRLADALSAGVPTSGLDEQPQALEATVELPAPAVPPSWQELRAQAEALLGVGEHAAGLAALVSAIDAASAAGQSDAALSAAERLVRVAPDRIDVHQRRLEVVIDLGDRARLREAYLDLADALGRQGEDAAARAVYARVLVLDPGEERARAALGIAPGTPAPTADQATAVRIRVPEPESTGDDVVDFEVLLRRFKDGVARSVGDDDFGSRYDLGVAFKEMGLLDDAVAEFQKALGSRVHRLPAYEALGQCFVEQGRHQVAITLLSRALLEPVPDGQDERQRVGMRYLLAYANEALQRQDEARTHYQRVSQIDPNFRDVAARLAALGAQPS